jgi:hypothetical protein
MPRKHLLVCMLLVGLACVAAKQASKKRSLNVLALGDSITQGRLGAELGAGCFWSASYLFIYCCPWLFGDATKGLKIGVPLFGWLSVSSQHCTCQITTAIH